MKICLIGPAPPLRGGIAHYNTQLAFELAKRHQVSAISFSRQYPALLFPGRSQLDPSPHVSGPIAEALLDSINPLSWLRASRRIARHAPDLIVVHWWNPFFAPCIGATVRLVKRRGRAVIAFICHNVVPHEPVPLARSLTRFALAAGDAWLVLSMADRRDLESLGLHGTTLVTPQPPPTGFGDPLSKEDARRRLSLAGPTLLYFGLIRSYKGLPNLIEAMPAVVNRVDCTLLVVGEFYERKEPILNLVQRLGLESRVRIIDRFVPNQEVSLYFSAADLVVLPYESATQSGIVPMAYAFERPVIATRVGGLPELVHEGETGFLVEPGNPRALAEAIIRYYSEGREAQFRRRILDRSRFSWEELVRRLESVATAGTRR